MKQVLHGVLANINITKHIIMKNYTWIFDPGHGGMINGIYQTDPRIWKRSYFKNKILLDPSKYNVAQLEAMCDLKCYEGEVTRDIVKRIIKLCNDNNIRTVNAADSEIDVRLEDRVAAANNVYATNKKCIFVSVHCNAFNKQAADGYSVFTTKGTTSSDKIATIFYDKFNAKFPAETMRKDLSDGDVDWEDNFYVLKHTAMPAILTENLFYTNYDDCVILNSEDGRQQIAQAHFDAIMHIEQNGY